MNQILEMFEPATVERVGWALVHSVWQIVLIGFAFVAVNRMLVKRSANSRYLAGCLSLMLMTLAPVATYWHISIPARVAQESPPLREALNPAVGGAMESGGEAGSPVNAASTLDEAADTAVNSGPANRLVDRPELEPVAIAADPASSSLVDHFRQWLPRIVTVWMIGVVLLSLRPLIGFHSVAVLRRRGVSSLPEWVRELTDELAKKMRLGQSVQIVRSTLVKVPAVVGWFRPLILLPACLLTRLSEKEIRAVIAHELAHVRRHDYLVNLLQRTAETLLFFHPFVWWVSHRIRAERENCCDDLALAAVDDKAAYVRALLEVDELGDLSVASAMGADGGSLLARVRRITGCQPAVSKNQAWLSGLALALVLPALMVAFPNAAQSTKDKKVMEVRVVDPRTEAGVPGVRLQVDWEGGGVLQDQVSTTDSTGVVPVVVSGMESYDLRVWILDDRFVPKIDRLPANAVKPRPQFYDYRVMPGVSIGGRIVGERGEPLAGAEVSLTPGQQSKTDSGTARAISGFDVGHLTGRTDDQGKWHFPNAPTNISQLMFSVEHAGHRRALFGCISNKYSPVMTFLSAADLRSKTAEVAMKAAFPMSGIVVDSSHLPLAGATVKAGDAMVLTGADGRFNISPQATGWGHIGVTVPGYVGQSLRLNTESEMSAVTFRLETAGQLRMRVLAASGNPLAGARVALNTFRTRNARWSATTDEDGRVAWDSAPSKADYRVSKRGHDTVTLRKLVAGKREHIVRLQSSPTITGTAVDADTGRPIPKFDIQWGPMFSSDSPLIWSSQNETIGSNGRFSMQLRSGAFPIAMARFKAEAKGYQPAVSELVKLSDSAVIDFRMKRGSQ